MFDAKSAERILQTVKNFDALPDDAIVHTEMVKFTKDGSFEVTSTGVKLHSMADFRARCAETHYGFVRFNGEGQPPIAPWGRFTAATG
jgi:hypothetical protein